MSDLLRDIYFKNILIRIYLVYFNYFVFFICIDCKVWANLYYLFVPDIAFLLCIDR